MSGDWVPRSRGRRHGLQKAEEEEEEEEEDWTG
jgi:hypothetical protein